MRRVTVRTASTYDVFAKAGVMLLNLSADANRQLALDMTPQSEADRQRSQRLRRRWTSSIVSWAGTPCASACSARAMLGRCERRKPRYTTRWEELVKVCCGDQKVLW